MSEASKLPYLSVEEYLKFEESSQERHEYVGGNIFVMTGGTEAHSLICSNLVVLLYNHLDGSPCRVHTQNMKLHVQSADAFYYPDIMVTCEPIRPDSLFKSAPVLIIEVQSPSTKHVDRREKLVAYRRLESVREYLIVSQNRQHIEVYGKDKRGEWAVSKLGASDKLCLNSLPRPLEIPVSAVYKNIEVPFTVEEEEEDYLWNETIGEEQYRVP